MDGALAEIVLKGGALALMAVAAIVDVRSRRIPNVITLGGAAVGLVANVVIHQQQGALSSLAGWAAGVALLAIPFVLGGMGAGDVKLLALAGAWGGPSFALYTVLFGALVGGAIAAALLIANSRVMSTAGSETVELSTRLAATPGTAQSSTSVLFPADSSSEAPPRKIVRGKLRIPYGPALAVGGLVALLLR